MRVCVQDHRAAAALPSDLWEPGEDAAACAGLVETPVCPQGGETQDGKHQRLSHMFTSFTFTLTSLKAHCRSEMSSRIQNTTSVKTQSTEFTVLQMTCASKPQIWLREILINDSWKSVRVGKYVYKGLLMC